MAKLLKLRRGTTSQHNTFTGAEGEVTIDTTKDTAVVHDGSQAGGRPLAREDMSNVSSSSIASRLGADSIATTKIAGGALPTDVTVASANIVNGTIVNADVNASAAIAGTKISPNFGSQNITTTGTLTMSGSLPTIILNDENNENDFNIQNINGTFAVGDIDAGAARLEIASSGTTTIRKNLDCLEGVDVTGNISVSGTVDGRDVAADGTKLDGIESGATADQSASEILTLIKTVDGAGSGLDADTLDGVSSGSFARSDANDTLSGNIALSSSSTDCLNFSANASSDNRGIAFNDRTALSADYNDGYLRINNQSEFSNGVYTPGVIRADGGFHVDGAASIDSSGNIVASKVPTLNQNTTGNATTATRLQTARTIGGTSFNGTANITPAQCTNSDTVDNLHASSFVRSDADDTVNATLTTRRVHVQGNYDIRLSQGNWTGEYGSKIQYHSNNLYCQYGSGSFIVRNPSGTNTFYVDGSGNAVAQGNVTAYSDARLKTDISTINDALSICGKLRGVSYKWLKDGSAGIGVIAQEVEEVLPEVVVTSMDPDPATGEETEVKSVDYGKIVGVLINAINELKEEVEELKNAKITG